MLYKFSRKSSRFTKKAVIGIVELVWLLPLFLIMVFFIVNVGVIIFTKSVFTDAVYASARASAQAGGAYVVDPTTNTPIYNESFINTLAGIPGMPSTLSPTNPNLQLRVLDGATCTTIGPNSYVEIEANYNAPLPVPAFNALLRVGGNGYAFSTIGVARCEVVPLQ